MTLKLGMLISSGVNAICSRTEVAGDVNASENVDTFQEYVCVNLWVASFNSFGEN